MSAKRDRKQYTLFSAVGATGSSVAIPCSDFRNAIVSVGGASANGITYKFQGAI